MLGKLVNDKLSVDGMLLESPSSSHIAGRIRRVPAEIVFKQRRVVQPCRPETVAQRYGFSISGRDCHEPLSEAVRDTSR